MSLWPYALVAFATTALGYASHNFPLTMAFLLGMLSIIISLDLIYQELKQLNTNKTDSK